MKSTIILLLVFISLEIKAQINLIPCINTDITTINAIDLCNSNGEEEFAFTGKKELYSEIGEFNSKLIPVKRNFKWGVISRESSTQIVHKCIGKCPQISLNANYFIIIPFEYELITSCNNEYCIAFKNGKAGVINAENKVVIDFKYDHIEFSDDLLLVKQNKRAGFIKLDGKEEIPLKYDDAKSFSEKLAVVYLSKNCGYIDKKGKNIIPPIYNSCYPFTNGVAAVKKGNKWGYIQKDGSVLIDFKFDNANPFINNIATAKENNKWYLIDITGKKIKEINADNIYPFSCGLARFKKDSYYGFINQEGLIKIEPTLQTAEDFKSCLSKAIIENKNVIIDSFGKKLLTDYDKSSIQGEYIIVEKNYKKGLIDKKFKDIITPQFDDIKIIDSGTFIIKNENLWTFISSDTKNISESYQEIDLEKYNTPPQLSKVCKLDGCGVFDIKYKKLIIPPLYQEINIYQEYIIVKKDNKYGMFDRTGNILIPTEYDEPFEIVDNVVKFKRNERYGVYSIKNKKEVIPNKYKEIFLLKGLEIETTNENGKKTCFSFEDFKEIKCLF